MSAWALTSYLRIILSHFLYPPYCRADFFCSFIQCCFTETTYCNQSSDSREFPHSGRRISELFFMCYTPVKWINNSSVRVIKLSVSQCTRLTIPCHHQGSGIKWAMRKSSVNWLQFLCKFFDPFLKPLLVSRAIAWLGSQTNIILNKMTVNSFIWHPANLNPTAVSLGA